MTTRDELRSALRTLGITDDMSQARAARLRIHYTADEIRSGGGSYALLDAACMEAWPQRQPVTRDTPIGRHPMSDHTLHLDGHPVYDWRLQCDHEHGADGWWPSWRPIGAKVSDDCWLASWWDECGRELLSETADWPKVTTLPIPVEPDGSGWDGDVTIVPALSWESPA